MTAARKIDNSHPFMQPKVIVSLKTEISKALDTMTGFKSDFGKPELSMNYVPQTQISVILKLNSLQHQGEVRFHFHEKAAQAIIEKMTGSNIDCQSTEILDGMGEVSNIFYGAAKTKLNSMGYKLNVSVPSPYFTKDIPEFLQNYFSMILPMNINGFDCSLEIILA
jgi:chemotaxis protein CheX